MKKSNVVDTAFQKQQHKFRGLVSEYRSRRFVKTFTKTPSAKLRSGLRELLLNARVALQPFQFDGFLGWINHQIQNGLSDLSSHSISYDELSGIFTRAPVASLHRELLWITARIKADAAKLNDFRSKAVEVEQLVFKGEIEAAIELLEFMDRTYGVTLWSVQLRIALEHAAGGLERQKRYTAMVRAIYKRGLLGFITYHTSVRNEDRSTLAKYCEDIRARIERHRYYEPFVKTYARYRLAGEWPISEAGFADILRVEQSHSIIDIYETFVAVSQEIARREDLFEARKGLVECLRNLTGITDFRLDKTAQVIDGHQTNANFGRRRTEISDALFSGKAKLATKITRRILKFPTNVDPWQYIYAGIAISHARRPRPSNYRYPIDIPSLIGRVLSRCDSESDTFAQLEKMVFNLRGLVAAAGLIDMMPLLRRSGPDDAWRPWLIGMNSPTNGVEDLLPGNYQSYVSAVGQSSLQTEIAWGKFHGYEHESSGVSQVAVILFSAAHLLRKGEFQQVAEMLASLYRNQGIESIRSMAAAMLLHAYFGLGDRQSVIELIADEGSRTAANRHLLPIQPALKNYEWPDYRAVTSPLAAPIALHLLWSSNESGATASLLRYATGSAIRHSGVQLPSRLMELSDTFPKHRLVYFLKNVCVPEILDVSRVLKGTRALFEERMAICACLRSLDTHNASAYQDEMMSISNQLAQDEGQWIVDRTRVHVDTDALLRWATKEFSEDFSRYRDLVNLDIGSNQNFDDVLKELVDMVPSGRTSFTPENEADAVLVSILTRCGEEFLNNPSFGFDYYLSKRIRHQSFIGLIRGPLEFANLITTRESESGGYHNNDFWLSKFASLGLTEKDALNNALAKFSAKFDETLIAAKDKRFHLRSQERPNGLMFLEISPQIVTVTRAVVRMDTSIQDFISTVVALLWAALEPSLASVRRFVSEELKSKIAGAFDELRANVRKIAEHDPTFLDFDLVMGGCSRDVQHALDDVVSWFSHVDIELHKRYFSLEQIVNIAIDAVLKCHRALEPNICRQIDGYCEMTANDLVFVHDVLFIAFDNVKIHSGIKKPTISVIVKLNNEDGTLSIEVRSEAKAQDRLRHEKVLQEIRHLIDGGNVGRRTRIEGKSGILKLAAVARQSSKGQIDFGFTDDGLFSLKVTYSLVFLTQISWE